MQLRAVILLSGFLGGLGCSVYDLSSLPRDPDHPDDAGPGSSGSGIDTTDPTTAATTTSGGDSVTGSAGSTSADGGATNGTGGATGATSSSGSGAAGSNTAAAGNGGAGGASGSGGQGGAGGASGSSGSGGAGGAGGAGGSSGSGGSAGTGSGGMDAGCTPESDSSLCSRLRKDCGPISGVDNCGTTRNVSSCGSCTSPKICGAGGTVNVCALYAGTPYGGTPVSIGGTASTWYTVEAEEYDVGGEGISYHDTTSTNTLGGLRTGANEGVDIEAACGSSGGCYDIGAIAPGEWTKYAINVVTSGAYMVQLGAASATSKNMHIEVDTRNVTGSLAVNTGGSTTFRSISPTVSFSMSSGPHVVTFAFDDGSMALNWVKFQRQ